MAQSVTVRRVARRSTDSQITVANQVVSIADGGGEEARRLAVVAAVIAAADGLTKSHEILYNGNPIPAWDFPAGYTF